MKQKRNLLKVKPSDINKSLKSDNEDLIFSISDDEFVEELMSNS